MATSPISDSLELYHAATDHPTVVGVPDRRMLALDGLGKAVGQGFRDSIDTLYAAWDSVRAAIHRERGVEARRLPLECAWWTHPEPPLDDLPERFVDRQTWHWQLMADLPPQAADRHVDAALAAIRADLRPGADLVRSIDLPGGRAAQILHLGSLAAEPASLARLLTMVRAEDLRVRGHIHEILLTDPRHTDPRGDRRRAILRLPIDDEA